MVPRVVHMRWRGMLRSTSKNVQALLFSNKKSVPLMWKDRAVACYTRTGRNGRTGRTAYRVKVLWVLPHVVTGAFLGDGSFAEKHFSHLFALNSTKHSLADSFVNKTEVFKRTVKFGFVTEDQSDIVQRFKAGKPLVAACFHVEPSLCDQSCLFCSSFTLT